MVAPSRTLATFSSALGGVRQSGVRHIETSDRKDPVPVPGVIGVIGIGVYPGPWVDMALRVASTLF